MKVSDLGEFKLIELLTQTISESGAGMRSDADLIIGIGDDAAVWRGRAPACLGTTDTLIQGIHFDLAIMSWHDLGWKSLAVNISDIAAMGGVPEHTLISLGLPPDIEIERVIELYQGMAQVASMFDMCIAGGDMNESPSVTITPTVIGSVEENKMLLRSGAIAGDLIAVTGNLGASAAGLAVLKERKKIDPKVAEALVNAHLRPRPRVAEGRILAECGVKSAIDISDGLLADLKHICEASKVGATILYKDVPVNPAVSVGFPDDAMKFALSGGEDYEILFTASSDTVSRVRMRTTTPITVIGEITNEKPGSVSIIGEDDKEIVINKRGWEHFGNHF